jgi:hypothetical protein
LQFVILYFCPKIITLSNILDLFISMVTLKKPSPPGIYPGDESINFVVPPRFIDALQHQPQKELL